MTESGVLGLTQPEAADHAWLRVEHIGGTQVFSSAIVTSSLLYPRMNSNVKRVRLMFETIEKNFPSLLD